MIEDNNHESGLLPSVTIELRGPGSAPTLGNNGGCQHRSRSAREFASSNRSNLRTANLHIKMRQLSMVTNDTQWWLIRATEIALVVYVAFYSARSDVWSYVGLVEDFMYKGHRGNRHLNRHGYVMHPTRENRLPQCSDFQDGIEHSRFHGNSAVSSFVQLRYFFICGCVRSSEGCGVGTTRLDSVLPFGPLRANYRPHDIE